MADGVSHSSIVSAYAACVLCVTSMPSCLKASVRRLAKNTLLSITSSFAEDSELMREPPSSLAAQHRAPRQSRRSGTAIRKHNREAYLLPVAELLRPVRILPLREWQSGLFCPRPRVESQDRTFAPAHWDRSALELRLQQGQSDFVAGSLPSAGALYEESSASPLLSGLSDGQVR